jgi:hypothetical protein
VSIDPRLRYSDNLGACPCLDLLALGRVMEVICNGHQPTLAEKVKRVLAELLKKLAK